MFKFVPGAVRHAWWPVTWKAATEDGEVVNNQIEMRFVLHDDAEFHTLSTEIAPAVDRRLAGLTGTDREAAVREGRVEVIKNFAIAWRGIEDEGGSALAWSDDNLGSFLQIPGVYVAVYKAYVDARVGERPNG